MMAMNEDEARDLADFRLNKQYGPQPFKYYLALRNEGGQVVLDANGDPIMSNEFELRYTYPLNREGVQDEFMLQKNYEFVKVERK
jgi:hypothetical protein